MFRQALKHQKRKLYVWQTLQEYFKTFRSLNWASLWRTLSTPPMKLDYDRLFDGY